MVNPQPTVIVPGGRAEPPSTKRRHCFFSPQPTPLMRLTKPLDVAPANQCAPKIEEDLIDVGPPLIAQLQPSVAVQPRECPLHHPSPREQDEDLRVRRLLALRYPYPPPPRRLRSSSPSSPKPSASSPCLSLLWLGAGCNGSETSVERAPWCPPIAALSRRSRRRWRRGHSP